MRNFATFIVFLSAGTIVRGAETVEWTYALEAAATAPTLFPDAEKPSGVLIVAGPKVIRLAGDGNVVWETDLKESGATPATAVDLDGDGAVEVIVATASGAVVCLDEKGRRQWRHAFGTPAGGFKDVAAADVTPSPGIELLFGFDDGWLNCLSADGKLLWRFFGDKFRVGPVAVGDLDGDGRPEIVYGTDNGHVYCLTGAGLVKWRYEARAPYGRSGPNIADLDGDGKAEVLITRSNVGNKTRLIALNADGRRLWHTQDIMQGYVSNATVDFDGDGKLEVLHGDKGNNLYCDNADGSRRWHAELGGRGLFWAPAVADLDGDGQLEVIAGMRGKDPATGASVFVVSHDGTIQERLELGGGANAGPAVGDIDGDGRLELILITQGPSQVQVFTWKAGGRVAWPSLRGNSRMTAAAPNVAPGAPGAFAFPPETGTVSIDTQATFWGENVWRIAWTKPTPAGAFIELSQIGPGGPSETIIRDVKQGATKAKVFWNLAGAGSTTVMVRLLISTGGKPIFVARRKVEPRPPDSCRFTDVKAACDKAITAGKSAGADISGIAARLTMLRTAKRAVAELAAEGAPNQSVAAEATALRKQAAALLKSAKTLNRFWAAGGAGRFVVWQDQNPWDTFDPFDVPDAIDNQPNVKLTAYRNEFEDVALTLLNTTSKAIDVRCMFAKPGLGQKRPAGEPELARKHITLRRAVPVPSEQADAVYDALPELDRSRSITLPPGEGRQLWLVVNTHDLGAGTHKLTLYLGSLTKPPTIIEVPVQIDLWPITLPDDVYAKMNWSRADPTRESDQTVQDMIDHGIRVIYGPPAPPIPVDAKGNIAGPVDWSAFDAALDRVPNYFTFLWGGPPTRKWPEGVKPKADSPEEFNGFRTAIHALANHLKSKGIGYRQWAFYPIDEPWNTGFTHIPHLKHFCGRVKKADPSAQVYTDPAGLVRVRYLEEFKDLIDIWQPEANLLKRDPELVAWFQKNAKRFWFYEASSPGKNFDPLAYYRANAWIAWHFGAEGSGYWLYKGNDIWWPISGGDWSAVYQTNDRVVPSRRWEADRDGVEDYRALYVLSREIKRIRAAGHTAHADRAQALINEAVEALIGWQVRNIDEITRLTRQHHMDFGLLTSYRHKIAAEIMRLGAL